MLLYSQEVVALYIKTSFHFTFVAGETSLYQAALCFAANILSI